MVTPALLNTAIAMLVLGGAGAPGEEPESACLEVCAQADTTYGQRACLAREVEVAEAELQKVLDAALAQWKFEPDTDADPAVRKVNEEMARAIPEDLEAAQAAWKRYVEQDCAAVGAIWTNGSGRPVAVAACRLSRVRRRSLDVWSNYLEPDAMLPKPRQLCEP